MPSFPVPDRRRLSIPTWSFPFDYWLATNTGWIPTIHSEVLFDQREKRSDCRTLTWKDWPCILIGDSIHSMFGPMSWRKAMDFVIAIVWNPIRLVCIEEDRRNGCERDRASCTKNSGKQDPIDEPISNSFHSGSMYHPRKNSIHLPFGIWDTKETTTPWKEETIPLNGNPVGWVRGLDLHFAEHLDRRWSFRWTRGGPSTASRANLSRPMEAGRRMDRGS
jgi:hypothetical protein